jgi:hypothetical protein
MSIMYCDYCQTYVDTDFMDHCEWGTDKDPKHFKCDNCVDNELDAESEMQDWMRQLDEDERYIQEMCDE